MSFFTNYKKKIFKFKKGPCRLRNVFKYEHIKSRDAILNLQSQVIEDLLVNFGFTENMNPEQRMAHIELCLKIINKQLRKLEKNNEKKKRRARAV